MPGCRSVLCLSEVSDCKKRGQVLPLLRSRDQGEPQYFPLSLCLSALPLATLTIAVHVMASGPLIPLLPGALHFSSGQASLFAALSGAAIACTFRPGSQQVLTGLKGA
jgi:hypothetical protein